MARARNIKPGFFKNELLVEQPFEVRLLFIGLWTLADREGRLEDRPKKIKMEVFPADNVAVEDGLDALEKDGFIERYEVNGNRYIEISAWSKHQTPHVKEQASTIPARCKHGASPSDSLIPDSLIPSLSTSNEVDAGIFDSDTPLDETEDSTRATDEAQPAGGQAPADRNPCPIKRIVELYHQLLPELPRVEKLTKVRTGYIQQRWREDLPHDDAWRSYFADVRRSKFLMGMTQGRDGKPPFRADLEWLTRPGNFAKVAEGKYHS